MKQDLIKLGKLFSKSDSYHPVSSGQLPPIPDTEICKSIWTEAYELRKSVKLIPMATSISCPVISIHGDYDPHPIAGVINPLNNYLPAFRWYVLSKCGHKPWIEKYARELFYKTLTDSIAE
jgi:pimeloyl-ACP methyl ester carboxylesterase